jgi:hypothetical protein
MTSTCTSTSTFRQGPETGVPPFDLPRSTYPVPIGTPPWFGEHSITATDGAAESTRSVWRVWVYPIRSGGIARYVTREGQLWKPDPYWVPETVIWPTWSLGEDKPDGAALRTGSPLEPVEDYWSRTGNRIRESAKWMAGVLGLGLAALVGTSPLQNLRAGGPLDSRAVVVGALGFALLAVTLFLVLQVLRPQATSYTDVQRAGELSKDDWLLRFRQRCNPLRRWNADLEAHADLYLPSGVTCLSTLRQLMVVDELTLMALSCALGHEGMTDQASRAVQEAQKLRMARLREWRTAASRIVLIGEFYRLRRRSAWATYAGALCAVLGTAAIVGAFVWPW